MGDEMQLVTANRLTTSIVFTSTSLPILDIHNFHNIVRNPSGIVVTASSTITTTPTYKQIDEDTVNQTLYNTTSQLLNSSVANVFKQNEITLEWPSLCLVSIFCLLIVITVIGNTLVILAVLTTRRLRTVTNCFVMSLAVADWLVGLFVMPPAVAVYLIGTWQLGYILCDIWISLDVLLCTASILSLCAISIDRYLAVTQPLNYSRRRRSKRLALIMILVVWILALAITCPPIFGWYEPGRRDLVECRYNQNEGYVVFSAMGSFFIPMAVMIYVYIRISCVVAKRHDNLKEIEVHKKKIRNRDDNEMDADHETSEHEPMSPRRKKTICRMTSGNELIKKNSMSADACSLQSYGNDTNNTRSYRNGQYELVDVSRTPSLKRSNTINQKTSVTSNIENWSSTNHGQINYTTKPTSMNRSMRVHQKSLSSRISSLKRESKTTRTLSIVVGGFIACWLPFFINYLITPFLPKDAISANMKLFLTWLGWFNSAINPFIYAFYSGDFRVAFWRLTLGRIFVSSTKPTSTMSIRR